jgi:hypothetical protein
MIQTMETAWLYAYSPDANTPISAYHTVYTGDPNNGRAIFATVSLSYLTTLSNLGAGAWILDVTPPFGPPAEFHDFSVNSYYFDQAISVTFGLSARGSEAYAQANVFYF